MWVVVEGLAGFEKGTVDFERVGQVVYGIDGTLAPETISLLR